MTLASIRTAERKLTAHQCKVYQMHLLQALPQKCSCFAEIYLWHASAAQRRKALRQTLQEVS